MHSCGKCSKLTAFLLVLAGVLFLLVDLGVWNFWNLQWWTVLFLIVGVTAFGMSCCGDCKEMRGMKKK